MPDRPLGFAFLGCDAEGRVRWTAGDVEGLCGAGAQALAGRPLRDVLAALGDGGALARAALAGAPARGRAGDCEVEAAPLAGGGACVSLRRAPAGDVAAAESEERYRRLVDACPEPIVVHAGGAIRFVNPAAVEMLGAASEEELLGRPMMDFVHPEYRGVVAERVRKMLETGGPALLLEEKIVRPDGSVLDVEIAGAAVWFQGEPAIQLVGRDVTARRREEAERRRLEAQVREARRRESVMRLAEGVATRLSQLSATLLDVVDQSLVRGRGQGERLDPGPIRQVGLRMAALTEQLLGAVGRRPADAASANLSALVLELSQTLESELDAATSLSLDLPVELPAVVVDTVQMRRVVHCLVRNAIDALGSAGGAVRVRTRAVEVDEATLARVEPPGVLRAGTCVALEVRDEGCGMDEATSARVFEPFFSTKSPARGLELAEVAGLVGAQGGALCVESAPGHGTTVRLLFPALPAPPVKQRPSRAVARLRRH